jgi:predicted site-specific integrase-resolvase
MRQAAAFWGVSYNTFRKLVREGLVPPPIDLGLGRQIFDREQHERAFDAMRKGAA